VAEYSVNWSARVATAAGTITAGQVVVNSGSGYVVATTANRTSYGRPDGIAATTGDSTQGINIIEFGDITAALSGLGSGTAAPIRVSSAGALERVATPSASDEVVGKCETDGRAHVAFGVLSHRVYVDSGGGGTPGGSDTQLQRNAAGSFGGISGATSDGTSLTVLDVNFKVADESDATKIAQFQCSGITTGTTRTYTLQDASGTLVMRTTSETLTNKSMAFGSNTFTMTSAQLATACSDETGSGALVFGTGPALSSPVLTTPQINDTSADHQYVFAVSELAADRTVTLPLLAGDDTFVFAAFAQTLTNKTFNVADNSLTATSGAQGDILVHNGTKYVRLAKGGAGQVLVVNALGTDTSFANNEPAIANVTGLGSGVATFLATPSSANLASAVTGETGSGALVFGTSPTISAPTLSGISLVHALRIDGATTTNSTTGSQNNVAINSGASGVLRYTGAGTTTFTGISATGVSHGQLLVIEIIGGDLTLAHEDAASTAANRFNLPAGVAWNMYQNAFAILRYDGTSTRWRVLGAQSSF
jgi:hypothetical protein